MKNVIFEHLKEEDKEDKKSNYSHKYRFCEDVLKQLEKFSLKYSSCNHFHTSNPQLKTLANSFGALIEQLLIKIDRYCLVSFDTNIDFGSSKIC